MAETTTTSTNLPAALQNDLVKKLVWTGVMAAASALAAIAARKAAEQIWTRVFNEPPPID